MQCDHVKNLDDEHGNPQMGSWNDKQEGSRYKVVCRYCGKFYGYRPQGWKPDSQRTAESETASRK